MNIKNKEANQLARQLSKLTGESLTTGPLPKPFANVLIASAVIMGLILPNAYYCLGATVPHTLRSHFVPSTITNTLRQSRATEMIIDTSAIIAILRDEPEAKSCARADFPMQRSGVLVR